MGWSTNAVTVLVIAIPLSCHSLYYLLRDYTETKYNWNIFSIAECVRKTILALYFKFVYFHSAIFSVLYPSLCKLKGFRETEFKSCIVHTKRLVQKVQTVRHMFLAINQMSVHCGYPRLLLLVTTTSDFYKQKHKNTRESTWAFWDFSFITILTCWMDVMMVYYFGNTLV